MPESQLPSEKIQRLMAFDFGTKRIGIAVGQRLTGTGEPLSPIKANDGIPNWQELERIINTWNPDAFVVGLPLNMDGTPSSMSARANKFAKRLEGRYHRRAFTHDERLSSFEAKGYVMAQGGSRDFGKNSVDGLAAQLVLESWMAEHPLHS
ncbi:MAG: Holliday junction resolvase RuvX [Venatoribacter sp.]